MRIVITGASGFIGRFCVPMLEGFEVHLLTQNLLEPLWLDQFLDELRPTHLLHLAWITTPGIFWNSSENDRWAESSIYLLEKFKEYGGIRAVVAGSCADIEPTTLYGTCKRKVLEKLRCMDLSWAWGRIFHLFGPYEHPKKLIPSLILSFFQGKEALCSHGNQVRDYLFVEDVARALAQLLFGSISGEVDIGSGSAATIRSLCLKVAEKMEGKVVFGAVPSNDPPILVPDVKRLYKPTHRTLDEGLDETIAWWKATYNNDHSHI